MARHTERGEAPSRLAAGLMRAAVALFAASGLLAAAAVHEAKASPCEVVGVPYRPVYCDRISKLDLDFLNDEIEPPSAWNVNAGAAYVGDQVAFQIYALTDDPRFYQNVTYEVKYLRFKFHGFRRQHHLRYEERDGNPRWVLDLRRERPQRSTGTLEVRYRCKSPSVEFVTNFFLTIKPRD